MFSRRLDEDFIQLQANLNFQYAIDVPQSGRYEVDFDGHLLFMVDKQYCCCSTVFVTKNPSCAPDGVVKELEERAIEAGTVTRDGLEKLLESVLARSGKTYFQKFDKSNSPWILFILFKHLNHFASNPITGVGPTTGYQRILISQRPVL